MKTCTKCNETKAYSEYYVRRASRDGLTPLCKSCVKARDKAYRAESADKIRAYHADYRRANADRLKAYQAEYYKANADQIRAQHAEYYNANADQRKACQAEYYNANTDQYKAYRAANPHISWESNYRSRCRAYGYVSVIESFTREEMIAFWNNGEQCIYCNGPFQEADHVIPVGLGGHHVISNVAPSCTPCNRVNTNTVSNTRKTLTNA